MKSDSWLIIGGGIHGVHLAIRLIAEVGVSPKKIQILDPAPTLLERWQRRSAATGMQFLRSPSVHHLALEPFALVEFSGVKKRRDRHSKRLFAPPFDRPCLGLFNAHCLALVKEYGLEECHLPDAAKQITIDADEVVVSTLKGDQVRANRAILALGVGENPSLPAWAPERDQRVQSLFDFDAEEYSSESPHRVAVIGGGISAVQSALKAARQGHSVTLVSRHAMRKHQFDSDPGWLGPKYMRGFTRERSMARRRVAIRSARHRGSIPPELSVELHRAISDGLIDLQVNEVQTLVDEAPVLRLRMKTSGDILVDRIILATGLESHRPGGELIERLIATHPMPCANCGYPIVDRHLRWHSRIFVAGALAELELGPSARNISGARRAGERIAAFLRGVENAQPSHVWHPKTRRRLKRSS